MRVGVAAAGKGTEAATMRSGCGRLPAVAEGEASLPACTSVLLIPSDILCCEGRVTRMPGTMPGSAASSCQRVMGATPHTCV